MLLHGSRAGGAMLAAPVAVLQVHLGARSSSPAAAHWTPACVAVVVTLVAVVLVLSLIATVPWLPPPPVELLLTRNIVPATACVVPVHAYPPTTTLLGSCVVNPMDGFGAVPLAEVVLPNAATPTYVPTAQATFTFPDRRTLMVPVPPDAVQISVRAVVPPLINFWWVYVAGPGFSSMLVTLEPVAAKLTTTTLTFPGRSMPAAGILVMVQVLLEWPFDDVPSKVMPGTVRSSTAAIAAASEEVTLTLLVTDPGVAAPGVSDSAPPVVVLLVTALERFIVGATCVKSELPAAAKPATTQL